MSLLAESGQIALVVAAGENGVIGCDGAMPWRMPSDLKNFRRLTMGCPVIMGRKTFQSIGRALDGRLNIVVSRNASYQADGAVVAESLEEAIKIGRHALVNENQSVMVIGGGEIYRAALPMADWIYLTRVQASPDGDTTFPKIDKNEWVEVSSEPLRQRECDQFAATFLTYQRRSR